MTKHEYLSATFKSEDEFTIATHRFINANYPELRHFYFHVANESATSLAMRVKLSNMGVLAGVPDFVFILPKTWFMELKMPNGAISPKQKKLHELWRSKGIIIEIARSSKEVVDILERNL